MATLVKIKEVLLYVGLSATGTEQYQAKQMLDGNNIPHLILSYFDVAQQPSVFSGLNTWAWGQNNETKTFTAFPIVTWKECYDTFDIYQCGCQGVAELANSSLIANKTLV